MLETFQPVARGSDPDSKMDLLKARSRVGAMANSNMQETLSPHLYYLTTQLRPLEGCGTQHSESPMSIDMRDEAVRKRCIPIPPQTRAKLMAVGTWRMNFLMAMGMQWTGIRSMAVGTIHSYQWKNNKNAADRDQTDGCMHSANGFQSDG